MQNEKNVDPSPDGVKRARKDMGLTQTELANAIGYSRNYVTLVEVGSKPVTTEYLIKLKELLNRNPVVVHASQTDPNPLRASAPLRENAPTCRIPEGCDIVERLDRLEAEIHTLTRLLGARLDVPESHSRKKVG